MLYLLDHVDHLIRSDSPTMLNIFLPLPLLWSFFEDVDDPGTGRRHSVHPGPSALMASFTVILSQTLQSLAALAMSSPTCFGDGPRKGWEGVALTSPPVHLR